MFSSLLSKVGDRKWRAAKLLPLLDFCILELLQRCNDKACMPATQWAEHSKRGQPHLAQPKLTLVKHCTLRADDAHAGHGRSCAAPHRHAHGEKSCQQK